MFNRKRLEEQEQLIYRLKKECHRLKAGIDTLTKENQALKAELSDITKERDSLKKAINQNKPLCRTFDGITLSEEQNKIVDLLENTNNNYFITGKAGTGKSTVLNCFRKTTKKTGVAVVASTGAAALNVDGQTIHSLFRMDLEPQDTWVKSKVKTNPAVLETIRAVNVLIIDEVSMVRADVMDMIDARLKLAKKNDLPFGGCQVITFGDLYQLSPIARDRMERMFIENRYGTLFFFGAPEVKNTFQTVELNNVVRQTDQAFIRILNEVREGRISDNDIRLLNTRYTASGYPEDSTRVMLTNDAANRVNMDKLMRIESKEYQYETELGGNNPPAKEDVPFDFNLRLKVGARIMTTRNDPLRRFVNGSIGKVIKLSQDVIQIDINGNSYEIERQTWTKKVYTYNKETKQLEVEVVGWAKQFPLRLAWAITIHKSQGQTYDTVIIDYGNAKAFAAGQTYVALSRCRTLNGIYLTRPIEASDVYADREVLEYMKGKPQTVVASHSEQNESPKNTFGFTVRDVDMIDYPF